MDRYSSEVQHLQDVNLQRIWRLLRHEIVAANPLPPEIPGIQASAQQIRGWMRVDTNQPVLQHVTQLDLNSRGLTCVPWEIRLLTRLQWLFLHDNQLTTLPEDLFRGLERLQVLTLCNNRLTALPEGLFRGLAELEVLHLSHNQLTFLPEGLFQGLTRLRNLSFNDNQLTTLPGGLFQGLQGLLYLHLFNNRLVSFPEGLFLELEELRELYFNHNQLAILPEDLFESAAHKIFFMEFFKSRTLASDGIVKLIIEDE
jgi:Leucine-rich repeat (LRR) protein